MTFVVNQFSKFMYCPSNVHWQATKRILWYVKKSIDVGLQFLALSSTTITVMVDQLRLMM